VPLELFRDRNFSVSNLAIATVGFTVTSMSLPLMFFIQLVIGLSPTRAALLMVPMAVLSGVLAPFAGRLLDRTDPRVLLVPGLLLTAGALFWYAALMRPETPVWMFLLPSAVMGLGNAGMWGPLATTATRNLPPRQAGAGAGIYNTTRTMGSVSDAPLFIDDSPNMSLMEIRAKCRRLKQTNDLKLVVIDYLQLMSSGKQVESRQQEVSEFSRALKLLAKELEVPVVALSQLNRGPEMRNDKKPQLSDLRESGSIEQDADVVLLVHRPDFYDKEDRPGEADIIMAKHRNGPTETFHLAFLGAYSKFKDMPQDYNSDQGV